MSYFLFCISFDNLNSPFLFLSPVSLKILFVSNTHPASLRTNTSAILFLEKQTSSVTNFVWVMSCTYSWAQNHDHQGSFFQSFWVAILVFLCGKKRATSMNFIYIKKVLGFCQQAPSGLWDCLPFVFPFLGSANSPMPFFFRKRISPAQCYKVWKKFTLWASSIRIKVNGIFSWGKSALRYLFASSTVCSRFPLPKLSMPQDISKCHQLL